MSGERQTTAPGSGLQTAARAAGGVPRFEELLARFRGDLERGLAAWLEGRQERLADGLPAAEELTANLTRFLARGGKRLRPALVYYSYRGCGGSDRDLVMPLAMAVELLHTYLLIHDDIMDHAELRRGEPAAHVVFRDLHRGGGWSGSSEHFGVSAAILLGDLAESYAGELFNRVAGRVPGEALRRCFSTMCQEVIVGQYLEVTAPFRERLGEEELLRILRMKSGSYSVERPIQLGALAAEAPPETLEALSLYGAGVGEAFQLQDDLLGVFGDTETVGKPVGGDLAEGKHTLLIHHTLALLGEEEGRTVRAALGRPDLTPAEADRVRELIESSGARRRIGEMVERRLAAAREAVEEIDLEAEGAAFLVGLIDYLRGRER